LLGIVTVDDVIDVASQEITEDFQMAAAVTPLKESYSEASIWFLYRKRIGWLAFLLLVGLVSSTIIAHYEKTLSAAIVLTVFLPLLIDSGGNTGAQSSTLIVRAIAVGDVELVEWLRTLARELLLGMTLGATMGFISWFLGFFVGGFSISLIVASTMFSIVLVANIIGAALPLVLTRFGFDPAVASSPLITSIVDVIGLIIYLSIATYTLAL
jgi:magnesium transporter